MFLTQYLKVIIVSLALSITGCTSYGSVDGVSNLWREVPVDQFQTGVTKQSDVLELLGPPSQLINLHDQTVFYYLTQRSSGQGKIFIVWNQVSVENQYDRAIFFFDTEGVLQEVAYSKEAIAR
jgi:outer membrane protein assembly factor BamE (lipoprotein component of BamABCDE complex)